MSDRKIEVTVVGHICLDIIPMIPASTTKFQERLIPGKLVEVGEAVTSTGGAVSNTGIALHHLGVNTQLMGKIGDDLFGRSILSILRSHGAGLEADMIMAQGEQSSYSIVISPPHVDRIFLHCPGTNDTFHAADLSLEKIENSKIFHFGYPPLMKLMYEDGGRELADLLAKVKEHGLTVTLDMAKPDPDSAAGRVDWVTILQRVLPHVDVFFPSFEEIVYMLDRAGYEQLHRDHPGEDIIQYATPELLEHLSTTLIAWGTAAVVVKMGEHGLYIRTTANSARWNHAGRCAPVDPSNWSKREWLAPVYKVDVAGTTGAGDCTIAGFLAAMVKGMTLEEAVSAALAVGACNVEKADATSGIPEWANVQARLNQGWQQRKSTLQLKGWKPHANSIWSIGPNDSWFD